MTVSLCEGYMTLDVVNEAQTNGWIERAAVSTLGSSRKHSEVVCYYHAP